jgi:DNA-binding transcriptional LysR family regulator
MATPSSLPGLQNLLTFVRVVEAGSFAEAARRMGTTTSAMSKAIARFEHSHGVRLLHRTTHSLSLTDEGERLLEAARHLLREAERLEASLGDNVARGARGRVRISAPDSFAGACVVPFLPQLRARFPDVDIDLRFEDALVDLGAEGIDIALRMSSIDGQPGVVAKQLMTYPFVLCAASDYLARRGTPLTPEDLGAHDHVSFRHRGTGQIWTWQFCDPANPEAIARHVPSARMVVDDGTTVWRLMREGLGIAWAPAWLGIDDLRSGRVVEVLKPWRRPEFPLSAVRLDRRHTPERTRVILDFLEEIAPA